MENYWLSRRPKLTAEQLFIIARQHLLNNNFRTAMNLLKYCTYHHEATWLLEFLRANAGEEGEPIGFLSTRHWLEYIFRSSNHLCAVKYRLCFSNADKPGEFEEALALANNGKVLAQYCLGRYYVSHGVDFTESDFWHSKAAAQGFSESGYEMFKHRITYDDDGIVAESLKYVIPFFRVASEGSIDAMDLLLRLYQEKAVRRSFIAQGITELDMVILGATLYFRTGIISHHSVGATYHFKVTNLPKLFVAGRTFEALRKYYRRDNKTSYEPFVDRAIELYCQVTSKARAATIQTFLILKELGVMKDIRRLIAKLVYATRMDAGWYSAS